ncbi:hypothetical protein ACH5RR_002441 [Cinchona calisaya]|uniref:Nodulin-like domain-containing protein n=1 Tax=Cinchona calisaya TaxID=153742 RepID=A0ABD3B6U6_9GENT
MRLQSCLISPAGKWLGFVTAIWVQAISGNNYTFSNYSDALKSIMKLTQLQLNQLSVVKDVGKAFGLLPGVASDRIPIQLILLIGSVEGFIGYGAQWLVVSQTIQPFPYWAMCIFMCLGGNSTTWMNTAILVTCIRNFKKNRGPVSGLLKGYVGLSTAIFTDVCSALFSDGPSSFLAMLAIIPLAVCLTAILFMREVPSSSTVTTPDEQKQEGRYLGIINILSVIVAVYLLVYDILGSDHGRVYNIAFTIILLILLASPLFIPLHVAIRSLKSSNGLTNSYVESNGNAPLLAQESTQDELDKNNQIVEENEERVKPEKRQPVIGEDHTILEALRTIDFWILFVSFLFGAGTGMTVMNNMGQMGSALGYGDVAIFISLLSIGGFFGRVISGFASEYFISKFATPRPIWNAIAQVIMSIGFILMAINIPGSLYMGSVVVGVCYGVRLACTVPIASELFGLKYYGLIYNVLVLNLPLGSFLFSGLLAGLLYDAQATSLPGGGNNCDGAHCYRLVYVLMAVACGIGFLLDVLLSIRTRAVYWKIHANKKTEFNKSEVASSASGN